VLVLVRHGETEANRARLLIGRAESPLTERGLAQARAVGTMLGTVARLVSSPLLRARRSAEALGLGLPVDVDERWIEIDYGEFDGQALEDVPAEVWRRWREDPSFRPPAGESVADMGTRVRSACGELFAEDGAGARADADVVVVSHVSPIKAAVAWALGADDGLAWRLHLATASVSVVGWGTDGPVLHRYNLTEGAGGGRRRW
jgi:broad specificity phosphatase PhoE